MDFASMAQCIQGAVPGMVVSRFNETLLEFMVNLRNTFPSFELQLQTAINELQLVGRLAQPDMVVKLFVEVLGEDGYDKCLSREEAFLDQMFSTLKFLKDFDLVSVWGECPDEVKENVWLYLIELASLARSYKRASATNTADVIKRMEELDKKMDTMLQQGLNPHQILGSLIGQAAAAAKK